MARPERNLYTKINSKLPSSIHHQAMTGAMAMNGTPDRYYDGPKRDLWVEYKALASMPRNDTVNVAPIAGMKKQAQGKLSVLQARWVERRWRNGRNSFVVLGLPNGKAIIIPGSQLHNHHSVNAALPIESIAAWITNFVGAV